MREIDPKVFGPGTWTVTHILALVSEESGGKKDYKFYSLFVYRMVHNLPCAKCRRHAVTYLDNNPPPFAKSGLSLFEWSVVFHNAVNKRLKKPIISVEDARKIYQNTELILTNPSQGTTCTIGGGSESCEDEAL